MELKVGLTIAVLGQVIRTHGTESEKTAMSGKKYFQLQTAAGTYIVPPSDFGPPGDFPVFQPASGSPMPGPFVILEKAAVDPEITALLSQATIEWVPQR